MAFRKNRLFPKMKVSDFEDVSILHVFYDSDMVIIRWRLKCNDGAFKYAELRISSKELFNNYGLLSRISTWDAHMK